VIVSKRESWGDDKEVIPEGRSGGGEGMSAVAGRREGGGNVQGVVKYLEGGAQKARSNPLSLS